MVKDERAENDVEAVCRMLELFDQAHLELGGGARSKSLLPGAVDHLRGRIDAAYPPLGSSTIYCMKLFWPSTGDASTAASSSALVRTSVYVHFPFCERKCPYCDFASIRAEPGSIPHHEFGEGVLAELERRRPALEGRELSSVFFGGGTPSLWASEELGRVLEGIGAAFDEHIDDLEVTIECNPSSLDAKKIASLLDVGVNRFSIGVQSLDDATLSYLGRLHDSAGALAAIDAAVDSGARVSGDLIFGTPGQMPEQACAEALRLVEAGIEHLSAYALTIEPGTRFGELHRIGKLEVATDTRYAAIFTALEGALASAGFSHYEVSNYARPEAEARHNLGYWRGEAYLGLGAGAVGCLDTGPGQRRRWRNQALPDRYLRLAKDQLPEESDEALGPQDIVREGLMLGLRTLEGVDLVALAQAAGVDPLEGRRRQLDRRIEQGDALLRNDRLYVPQSRWLHLDSIVSDLF